MQKIVINATHGGFELSAAAELLYSELAGTPVPVYHWDINRDDPHLVAVVETLGVEASTRYSLLKVVEVPVEVAWQIEEYDGREWLAEVHRTWGRYDLE